ncbi:hypothetical protein [Epilithonimonas mollis]|uniref:hypothetical protein n=1 Tax=Epilithonimonas mollis TaxID=216903 RepID=UPI000934E7C2|nr:hypothetical protein [Epilithonimonas mollis]
MYAVTESSDCITESSEVINKASEFIIVFSETINRKADGNAQSSNYKIALSDDGHYFSDTNLGYKN